MQRASGGWVARARGALFDGPTEAEREDFARFVTPALARGCLLGSAAVATTAGAWWVLDPVFFGDARTRGLFATLRVGTVLLQGTSALLLWLSPAAQRRPLAVVTPALWANGALIGWFASGLGGPSAPWLHFTYLTVFFSIPGPLRFGPRLGASAVGAACILLAYAGAHPAYAREPLFWVSVSFFAWAVLTSTVLGHVAFRQTVENFRRALALQELNATLEGRVREQTATLRALAAHLERVRDAERSHFARELHDELGQELAALHYAVRLAQRRSERESSALAPSLRHIASLVQRTSETTHALARELRPRMLLEMGLVPAVEALVARVEARDGLDVSFAFEGAPPGLDAEAAAGVFRVAQEALTNALRHSEASLVSVRMSNRAGVLSLRVEDNGRGFEPGARAAGGGLGLVGVRERAQALGGSLLVSSAPGGGTRVHLELASQPPSPPAPQNAETAR